MYLIKMVEIIDFEEMVYDYVWNVYVMIGNERLDLKEVCFDINWVRMKFVLLILEFEVIDSNSYVK